MIFGWIVVIVCLATIQAEQCQETCERCHEKSTCTSPEYVAEQCEKRCEMCYDEVTYKSERRFESYDYIVVGSGSGGAPVASRLSEDPGVTVLLLEAGGVPPMKADIPYNCFQIEGDPETDWLYATEPQTKSCLSFPEKRCIWSRWKGLGGCTTHNTMLVVRGNKMDYDSWRDRWGAYGWGYNDVLPFFIKSEDHQAPELADEGYHGSCGPLTITRTSYKTKMYDCILKAGEELGYASGDYNGKNQTGCHPIQLTQRNGLRCGNEKAYLRPAAKRKNIDIIIYAQVTKVEFDDDKRARFVHYVTKDNEIVRVKAKREIIISGGAVGTPHLLQLSGVGPKDVLEKHGVPLVSDLPVGKNLIDQVHVGLTYDLANGSAFVAWREMKDHAKATAELMEGKGPYTTANAIETMIFVKTEYAKGDWPDIQLIPICTAFSVTDPRYGETDRVTLVVMGVRPESRGELKIKSSNYTDYPWIDPMLMSNEKDTKLLAAGIKIAQQFMKTKAMQDCKPVHVPQAGCEHISNFDSDEYRNCVVENGVQTSLHMAGTARMGSSDDPEAVVDPSLSVKGVKCLRVADTSVMPQLTTGNPSIPAIMIGEKAAHMILQDKYKCGHCQPTE